MLHALLTYYEEQNFSILKMHELQNNTKVNK